MHLSCQISTKDPDLDSGMSVHHAAYDIWKRGKPATLKNKSDFGTSSRSSLPILLLLSVLLIFGFIRSSKGDLYTTYYASDYNVLNGTYINGTVLGSIQQVDSDYFIVRSSPSATYSSPHNPSGYNLLGSTTLDSGSVSNLTADDGVHMNFSSYSSGPDVEDYVDNNTSDVDNSTDIGTHSNFTAQKYGPDLINDTLTEALVSEYQIHPTDFTEGGNDWDNETNAWDWNNATSAIETPGKVVSEIYWHTWNNTGQGTIRQVDLKIRLDLTGLSNDYVTISWYVGATQGTETYEINSTNQGTDIVVTLSDVTEPTDGSWEWVDIGNLEIRQDGTQVGGKDSVTYAVDEVWGWVNIGKGSESYELDLEVQWTNVDYDEANEQLCIYGGTMGAENITVDVWNGTGWENLRSYLNSGWNNVSVTSYLITSNFTIRFKGSNETGDTTQDTWDIDTTLLHVWTEQYTGEVEFTGTSNTATWTQLNWTIDSAWDIANVSVTIQLYNYSSGAYPTDGYGYINYTSSSTQDTDENKNQTITTNPEDFRDSSGNWKVKVKGVKSTSTQFKFKADWIELKPTYYNEYTVSTEFTFSNMTTKTPTQLNFTIVSQYDIASVNVTIQVYNYTSASYATSGEAYLNYISSGTNETKLLSINTNPQSYTSNGNATIKITGILSTTTQYQQEINQLKLIYSYANSPPVLDPIGNKTINELSLLNFTATASDPDLPPQNLTFSLGAGAPSGSNITSAGYFTWTPTEAQGPGNYTIRIIVSDSSLTDREDIWVVVYEVSLHDVAVISVAASSYDIVSGEVVGVTVIVKNQGTEIETFSVTIFYNETTIGTETVTNLAPGDQKTLGFTWNTTGLNEADYRIRAEASSVSGETETNNNAYSSDIVKVSEGVSSRPFDWVKPLLYILPILFALPLLIGLKRKRKKKTKPRIEKKTDEFSQQFGITHEQIKGKKMLFEIDSTSDYQKNVSSFVSEAKNNDELLFILTNKNSILHSEFSEDSKVMFLLLTSETSSPLQINERETLLPASDLSVLFDSFGGIQKVETEKTINVLFDNLSDVILKCGFKKTCKFMRLLLESISSPKVTALFVFNPTAHGKKVSSSIRVMFQKEAA